jgi:bis(5'-nucleosyl)-tetraphosphatase (symmetrical)
MVTYAVGDIQGCDATLAALLERLPFDDARDALWFTGDIVNRGPRSLGALRRLVALSERLGGRLACVLGNHDLHLLAVASGVARARRSDTLDELLAAPDRDALLDWLRRRPLVHRQTVGGRDHVLVHAGLHPRWTADDAVRLADEAHAALRGGGSASVTARDALAAITSSSPEAWDDELTGDDRLACLAAVMTRVRTCRADGRLCRDFKGPPDEAPRGCSPWYALPRRASRGSTVVFGHWAALGLHRADGVLGLDTGCVWGGPLTAVRLDDGALFQQPNVEAP